LWASAAQRKITAAVLHAGVGRYVPWQFGVDYDVVGRGSGQDIWDEQLDVRKVLRTQSRTHWTIISTGMFTSFLFEPSFGLVDLENNRVHALGSWENKVTVATPEDIGRLTAAILSDEVARQPVHRGVVAAREVTFRPLDLDHPRPGIGEAAATVRRRHRLLKCNDQQSVECAHQ